MIDERARDYVLPISASIPPNRALSMQSFTLDFDASFVLTEIGVTLDTNSVPGLQIKFTDSFGRFVEQDLTPFQGEIPYTGNGLPILTPVWPNIVYPKGGNVSYWLYNTNPTQTFETDVKLFFRGRAQFPYGQVMNRDAYPKYFREIPFSYVYAISVTQSPQLNNPLLIRPDADFVVRGVLLSRTGSYTSPVTNDYSLQFKDQQGQFYQKQMTNVSLIAASKGAQRPSILVPEIYVQRNSLLYVDIQRNSGSALPQTLNLRLTGAKIFPSQSPC